MEFPNSSPRMSFSGSPPCRDKSKIHNKGTHFRYSVFVAEHPFVLFLITFLVVLICSLCNFVPLFGAPTFPDFSTPVMGFEARGTLINKRWRTHLFLGYATQRNMFSPVPPVQSLINTKVMHDVMKKCPKLNLTIVNSRMKRQVEQSTTDVKLKSRQGMKSEGEDLEKSRMRRDGSNTKTKINRHHALRMCDSPNVYMKSRIQYKTVYMALDNTTLMTADRIRAVCRLENKVMRSFPGYEKRCFKRNITISGRIKEICCPSWSMGNYMAALSWKTSCQDITEKDVTLMKLRLQKCSPLFHNKTLKENCWNYDNSAPYPYCERVPVDCIRYNAVFNILYYLTDFDFYGADGNNKLTYSLVLTPRWTDSIYSKKIYYKYIKDKEVLDDSVKLDGTEFANLKFHMFNNMLLDDLIYPSIALMVILTIMWFYTESLLLTFLLSISVVSAMILAYFVYMIILRLEFFPFLNITTLIFLVGIGADDAFVFTDVWRQAKIENPDASLTKITSYTLKHASLSMFVTSLTTSAAFIANFSSEITTIKLFGLYAGVAILAKFLLMVTWFPAVCVINEMYCVKNTCGSTTSVDKTADQDMLTKCRTSYEKTFARFSQYVFNDLLQSLVIRFKYYWIVLFSILTGLGLCVLLGYPGFQLPSSSDFQMFTASHPLERYALNLKDKFRFELSPSQDSATFPIDLLWGIEPEDYGNQLDPYSYGKFGWDPRFDIVSPESQKWLMDFCKRIRRQDFYAEKQGQEEKCFIEVYYNQSCTNSLVPELCNYPCCKNKSFPFSKDVLNYCAISSAYKSKTLRFKVQQSTIGNFIYNPEGKLIGIWIRIRSNVRQSRAYRPADKFWNRIESWVKREMSTAPPGLRRGWFISDMEFYNLQRSLSRGTLYSLSISIVTTFGVMVLTTRNVFVSLYAILTIIGTISVTIGSLVLSGWKLNILESITMSVAVGVSIDFCMHFGVAYCLAPDKQCRVTRVRYSLSRMGSAITMAAVTTFLAGAFMMPSDVLSYIQMGQFLMLVMTVSWFFSVFYFQSLCATIGPQGDMGTLNLTRIFQCLLCRRKQDEVAALKTLDLHRMKITKEEFDNFPDNETEFDNIYEIETGNCPRMISKNDYQELNF